MMIFRAHQDNLLSAEILNSNTSADCVLYHWFQNLLSLEDTVQPPTSSLTILKDSLFDGFPYVVFSLCLKVCLI